MAADNIISLNSITTLIASDLGRELDEPFKRMLAVRVDYWRSTLVARSLEKNPQQRKFFRQTLYIPMSQVDQVPCDIPMTLCKVSESTCEIPQPMRVGNTLFDYVGSIDGLVPFREAAPGTYSFLISGKYSSKKVFFEWHNTKIRILDTNKRKLPMVRVDGVFSFPMDVFEHNCNCETASCDWWDEPYPITGDMLQMVVQYIKEVDFGRKPDVPQSEEIEVTPKA